MVIKLMGFIYFGTPCRMNAIVAKRWLWLNEEDLKLNRFLAKVWASRHIKFISTPYPRM